jgi:glycosyltransferase involved in cell wall biosynthesis
VVDALKAEHIPVVWTLHDYNLLCPDGSLDNRGAVCERCKGSRFWQCTLRKCKRDSRSASLVATMEAEVHRLLQLPARVDAFIAPSAFLRDKFIEFGWPGDKIAHLPNFTNLPLATKVEMPEGRRVLYAGQLAPNKGVIALLESVRDEPGIRLDFAGSGPLRDAIETRVGSPDWHGAEVHVHGHVGADVLGDLIDAARVVAVPSEWYENGPYAVIEAFAHGRPVVASRIGGLPELVVDGVSGITVEPGSPSEIAAALRLVLDDPGLWARLAEGALRTAASRSAADFAVRLERLYGDVIGSKEA